MMLTTQAWAQNVAKIGTNEYTSLEAAFAAVQNGETIQLLANNQIDAELVVPTGKSFTLDLGGHTLAANSSNGINFANNTTANSSLTIQNGTINGTCSNAALRLGGKGNTLTIAATATINNAGGNCTIALMQDQVTSPGANSLKVYGTVAATGHDDANIGTPAISSNGTYTKNADINIYDGATVTSAEGAGVYVPGTNGVTCNITGGTITGASGVYIKAGTLNISGGSINGKGVSTGYSYYGNGAKCTGDALVVENSNYGGNGAPTVSVTGGTFKSTNAKAVASYVGNSVSSGNEVKNFISGGTFSSSVPEDYCVAGMIPAVYDATTGTYTVSTPVAKIGETEYGSLAEAFSAATDGQTITLLADCTGNGISVPVGKFATGLTVDFANYKYTVDRDPLAGSPGTQTQAFQLLKNNTITFKNGTIYSEKALMLVQNYSNLTLENMELTLNNTEYTNPAYTLSNNNGNVVIDGTTINANNDNSFAFDVCRYSSYPSVNVTVTGNSTINGNVEIDASNSDPKDGFSLTLNSGTMNGDIIVTGKAATAMAAAPDKTEVTKNDNFNQAAPQGYVWKDNGNGTSSLAPAVAKIGTTGYATLEAAIDAATDGQTITMLTDVELDEAVDINKSITLDLGGKTISISAAYPDLYAISVSSGTVTITGDGTIDAGNEIALLVSDGAVTIENGSFGTVGVDGGSLEITDGTFGALMTNGGTTTVNGGEFSETVQGYGGSLTINGGTFTAEDNVLQAMDGTITVTGGSFEVTQSTPDKNPIVAVADQDGLIQISGGTFTGGPLAVTENTNGTIEVSGGQFSDAVPEEFCADGFIPCTLNTSPVTYSVKTGSYVAKIDDTKYETLEEAIEAATAGQTITLLADIDATAQIVVDKQVALDLNGKTIEYKGTSTLKSGVIGVKRGGDLTINDSSDPSTGAIKSGNKAYAAVAVTIPGETGTGDAAKLTVNGGTLEGYYYGITGNGSRHGTEITINDGVIKGTCTGDNLGIYHPQDGTLTITGGTIEGYSSAIEVRSGTLNVTGGTFTATCPTYSCNPNGSGTTTTGAAIAIAQHTTNKAIDANISGGTFVVYGNGVKLSVANPQNNTFANVTVTGLNELIGESVEVPDGYAWKDNGDGTSSLAPAVAKIGDKGYASLKDAINAIAADGMPRTIQLVADIADQEALEIAESNKSITIDMNGHNITSNVDEPFKVTGNNINLTFTGTGELAIPADSQGDAIAMSGENGHLVVGPGVTLTEGTVFVRGKNNVIDINGKINVTGDQAAIETHGSDTNTGNVINVNDPAVITSEGNGIYAAGDANYNINGGSITGATAIYVKRGKLTVTDGTISATGDGIVVDNSNYPSGSPEVSIKGGTITSVNAEPVASYSGSGQPKVTGFIYAGLYNKEFDASLLAPGYVLQSNGSGMFTPVPGAGVARIGDVYFPTLDAAIAAVPTGNTATTIELLTNINAAQRALIPSNTNITLDLGGFTLRCDDDFTIAFFDGPAKTPTAVTENAQLTVKNGVVTSKKKYAIRTDGTGNTLTIAEDATVKAGNETDYAIVVRGTNNNVTVNGTVEVQTGTAISTNGNDTGNSITINEPAKITSPDDDAIYMPSGALTVNGGTITGATGIYFKSKNLTIPATSTAVITGTGQQRAAHYNGNGGDWTGDALVVDNANYPNGEPQADIKGGTFISTNALPIASYATSTSVTAPTKFVSGGKFNKVIPMDVIADGLICKLDASGDYYILEPGNYVAEVEGFGYETFAEAATAAGNDKIITLLANITDEYTLSEGQTLMVAKNGHTITVKAPDPFQLYTEDKEIDGVTVTIYTLKTDISQLIPDKLRSDWTGTEQSVPLVIKDGDYTLVKGTDYKLKDNTGADVDDIKKTDVGPVTFKVVGLGKYIGEKEVTWTIIKNINNDPIHIEIDPAVYTTENIDPKDYIHVYDGTGANRTELEYGADKDYTITVTTTIQDAKTYVNAITVTGTEKDPKYIGGEATFSMSVQPMNLLDFVVTATAPYVATGYGADNAASGAAVKDAATIVIKDGDGNDWSTYEGFVVTIDNDPTATNNYNNTGTYTGVVHVAVKPEFKDNFAGVIPAGNLTIGNGIDISQSLVVSTSSAIYTSTQLPPSKLRMTVKLGNTELVYGTDYTYTIHGKASDYVDAKTYSNAVTITGKGKYYGSFIADYTIYPRDLSNKYVHCEADQPIEWKASNIKLNVNNIYQVEDPSLANNVNLYLVVSETQNYDLKYADYTWESDRALKDPGEYTITFIGRGNFTGHTQVKVMVLKDIDLIGDSDIEIPVQILGSVTPNIRPSNIQDMVVRDGRNVLERGKHYMLTFKDSQGTIYQGGSGPYITQQGKYTAVIIGMEPYYSGEKTKDFDVVNEYYKYNAPETGEEFGVHITSGKELTATVGAKTGAAIDAQSTSVTVKSTVVVSIPDPDPNYNVSVTFTVNGIDNGAFNGANNLHWLDATALEGYTPATLDRSTDRGPFAKVPKQTLVFLDGTTATGENYIYKFTDTDFRCDELKIYDDISGVQTSFTEQDGYKWGFENPYEFKANTVTNTRQLNSGNGYTIYLPYALPTPTGIDAYTLTASKNDLLGFLPVTATTLEALTPYVLLANASGQLLSTTNATVMKTVGVAITEVTSAAVSGQNTYTMKGNLDYNDGIEGAYIMQGGNVWKPIVTTGSNGQGACILPMRAYIVVGGTAPAPALQSVFGMPGATDMDIFDHVGIDVEDGQYYDLQGRPVETPTRGVYVRNGKKVVIK